MIAWRERTRRRDSADEPYLDDDALRMALNATAGAIIVAVVAAVLWSVLTVVDEVARAPGSVAPNGQVQIVDSIDGGLITEILVTEGMKVEKGTPLVRFDRVRAESALAVAMAKKAALEITIERLTAFIDDRPANFAPYGEAYPGIVEREKAALAAQRIALDADISVIQEQLAAKRAEADATEQQIPAFAEELAAVKQARDLMQGLADKGLASLLKVAELIEQQARASRGLTEARGQHTVFLGQIEELTLAIASRRKKAQADAAEKRSQVGADYRALMEQLPSLQDKVGQSTVVAPVSGTVQSIAKPRVGQVVNPGDVVAEIVPADEGLLFEARLSTRDIGFVTRGQPAKVKIDAFDFSRYGALPGSVQSVSATTVADTPGALYYRMRIRLDRATFRDDDNLKVQAGMTGEVNVKTGTKTVFQYLWKPIYANLDLALTER